MFILDDFLSLSITDERGNISECCRVLDVSQNVVSMQVLVRLTLCEFIFAFDVFFENLRQFCFPSESLVRVLLFFDNPISLIISNHIEEGIKVFIHDILLLIKMTLFGAPVDRSFDNKI